MENPDGLGDCVWELRGNTECVAAFFSTYVNAFIGFGGYQGNHGDNFVFFSQIRIYYVFFAKKR
jgi:hypothetical protein